jgi:dihydroxy-acid dehydratase
LKPWEKFNNTITPEDFKGVIQNMLEQVPAEECIQLTPCLIEALGMSLPYSSSNPALSEEKKQECLDAGKAIRILLEKDIKRDIMTREA